MFCLLKNSITVGTQEPKIIHCYLLPYEDKMQETKYDITATVYNSTRQADPYLTSRLIHWLKPTKDKLYLDIGCGTGNYTIAISDKGVNFVGIDPSEKMLNEAKVRSKKVNWRTGTAEQIPTEDKLFDGAIATLTRSEESRTGRADHSYTILNNSDIPEYNKLITIKRTFNF